MKQEGSLARTHEDEPGLPRGRASLPADEVRAAQRERLIRAIIAASAEQGYLRITIADVVSRAKVSRAAFYTHFTDKDDCLLAAALHGRRLAMDRIAAATHALPADAPPEDALRASCRAYLRFLTDEPEFARVFYLELPSAGPRAITRLVEAQRQYAHLNEVWHRRAREQDPTLPAVPRSAYLAAVGATTELVRAEVHSGRKRLLDLEDTLVGLHLALLAGRPWT
ncbi:TetR/AcrR family transcriptional regulator [Amycolatopsis sp. K13G38]|uniref:TetR/AcrR family transcriptional regulator n=1 Tax=Amycolatopsis acididurans TaxID=2724524 RepID=A0ABX1JI36_9PSEU|nr:TetR/AcrR family transcriptional regulator [Amycolatopsis acididurans]NKQ59286.1 TetR/AcrR family transcriptional regulator [Amycolatopsis acididurans]